jgi:hypothetical protein
MWLCRVCGNVNFRYAEQCNIAVCRAPYGFPGLFDGTSATGVLPKHMPRAHPAPPQRLRCVQQRGAGAPQVVLLRSGISRESVRDARWARKGPRMVAQAPRAPPVGPPIPQAAPIYAPPMPVIMQQPGVMAAQPPGVMPQPMPPPPAAPPQPQYYAPSPDPGLIQLMPTAHLPGPPPPGQVYRYQ